MEKLIIDLDKLDVDPENTHMILLLAELKSKGTIIKSEKKILYIDLDGVTADFEKKILEYAPNFKLGEEPQEKVDELMNQNPQMFEELEPINDAIESINYLMDKFDVYFLSTPVWEIPESFAGKRRWVTKFFGEKIKKRLTLTHRKDLSIGDFLIDDRFKNGADAFTGEHIHFGSGRFPGWKSVVDYLETKL